MTPELWQQIVAALTELADMDDESRAARLQQLREADAEVARVVESLLGQQGKTPSFDWERVANRVHADVDAMAPSASASPTPHQSGNSATDQTLGSEPPSATLKRVHCPHCHHLVYLKDNESEVLCPDCGGSFQVRDAHAGDVGAERCLGKFQLLERVGMGAFGAVWRARDTQLQRIVALKIPHANFLSEPNDLERFQREARAAAQLRHPGIATVHEVALLEGLPTLVVDFVEGVPLKSLLQGRRLTFREAAALVAEVAETLDYAHGQGLVHRDIKPANIMMERPHPDRTAAAERAGRNELRDVGRPLLVDFGVALRGEAEITLTLDGHIIGTPAYMSPEQADGRSHEVDGRSDVYSLGVVLYEVLCGELPFRGSKLMMLRQVLHDDPLAPRSLNDKIPRDLETICLKSLCKEPARRYATAQALAHDLRRYLADEPIQARPIAHAERLWRWCRRNPAFAGLTAAVAVLLLTGTGVATALANWALGEKDRADGQVIEVKRALVATQAAQEHTRKVLGRINDRVVHETFDRKTQLTEQDRLFLRSILNDYEALATAIGDSREARHVQAEGLAGVAFVQNKLGERKEAEEAYRSLQRIHQQLVDDFPEEGVYQHKLSVSRGNLGQLLAETGRLQAAEREFRTALALQQSLCDRFLDDPTYLQSLARTRHMLASVLAKTRHPQAAEKEYRAALAIRADLAAKFQVVDYKYELALTHHQLAMLLRDMSQPHEAATEHVAALNLQRRLFDEFATIPEYGHALATTHYTLGILLEQQLRKPQAAEEQYRAALTILKPLAADFPVRPIYQRALAAAHTNLSLLLRDKGKLKDAEDDARAALAIDKRLLAKFPEMLAYRQALAQDHNNLAILLRRTGRLSEAGAEYRAAVDLHKELVKVFPTVHERHSDLAGAMVNLAIWHDDSKEFHAARQLLVDSVPHHRAALKANPKHPDYLRFYRNNRSRLTTVLLSMGDHAAAAAAAEEFAQAAAELAAHAQIDPVQDAYHAAAHLARCIPLANNDQLLREPWRKKLVQVYGDRTMELLRQAVDKGLWDAKSTKRDTDFQPLHSRVDFQQLLDHMQLVKDARPHRQ